MAAPPRLSLTRLAPASRLPFCPQSSAFAFVLYFPHGSYHRRSFTRVFIHTPGTWLALSGRKCREHRDCPSACCDALVPSTEPGAGAR